jgi:hypothetical protein
MTISNPDLVCSSEQEVNPGIKSPEIKLLPS